MLHLLGPWNKVQDVGTDGLLPRGSTLPFLSMAPTTTNYRETWEEKPSARLGLELRWV